MKALVDCNNFYCSCERAFQPRLDGRPVIVLSNNDGCIVSRSDEAKLLGIKMADPYFMARPLIEKHRVTVFSSNYNLYGDMSWRVMETLRQVLGENKVEVYSVDEAFVDLDDFSTTALWTAARNVKETVEKWTGIKVSVGAAPTRVLAKLANRLSKKDKLKTGCVMVLETEAEIKEALRQTAVEDIWGIGRRYAQKLKEQWGIFDAWQLRSLSEEFARTHLGGVVGVRLIRELKGIISKEMHEPLVTKKMIATTRMFGGPVSSIDALKEAVATYASRAAEKLRRQRSAAGIISVFIIAKQEKNDTDFRGSMYGKELTLSYATSFTQELIKAAVALVEQLYQPGKQYKKAGVILSGIVPDLQVQGNLFFAPAKNYNRKLMEMMDNINFSQRDDVLKFAASGTSRNWKMQRNFISKRYTTRWNELSEVR